MDKEQKRLALEELRKKLVNDTSLPLKNSNVVFGEGNPAAAVLFIGEAPGFHENELRRPFVGQSGKLLDKLLVRVGLPRKDVYITNIVKRRPPDNRDPLPEEIEAYKPYLARQIEILSPKIIVPLGRFSMNYFLPTAKITRDQGKVFEKDGRIIDRNWAKYHTGEVVFQPKGMSIEELQNGYYWIFRNTYTIKNILKRSLRSPKGIAYRIAANLSYRKKALKMPDVA